MNAKEIRRLVACFLAALLFTAALSACSSPDAGGDTSEDGTPAESAETLTPFPAFQTYDLDGNTVDNSIFAKADITVVNVWGTYCPPCINEMPDLAAWSSEMPDNVQIIGLVIDVGALDSNEYAAAERIVAQTGVEFTNLILTDDFDPIVNEIYGVPTTYFVDAEGRQLCPPIVGADIGAYKSAVEGLL